MGLPPTAPFLAAVPCLLAALTLITLGWTENRGAGAGGGSLLQRYSAGLNLALQHSVIWRLGLVQVFALPSATSHNTLLTLQAGTEAGMFLFVFLWTPTLSSTGQTPLGALFSSFMLAILVGSLLFRRLHTTSSPASLLTAATAVFTAASALAATAASQDSTAARLGTHLD